MTLVQLTHFVRIVELMSFSKAATACRIAQPALSRQIRALESELGAELLIRHAWGVTPTPEGAVLLAYARRMLADTQGARDAVRTLRAEPSGPVSFGLPTSVADGLLQPLVRRVAEKYPKIQLHVVDAYNVLLKERTLYNTLDLSILYDDDTLGALRTTPLLSAKLVLIGPPGFFAPDDVTPVEQLSTLKFILPSRQAPLRKIIETRLHDCLLGASQSLEVDTYAAMVMLVTAGEGCAILPYFSIHAALGAGKVSISSLSPPIQRSLILARPAERPPSSATEALEREIKAVVTEHSASMRWEPLFV